MIFGIGSEAPGGQLPSGICQLPAAAGQLGVDDPCAQPCGRKLSCAALNESFTCDVLSNGMGGMSGKGVLPTTLKALKALRAETDIHYAAANGYADGVKRFIENGGDKGGYTDL